MGAIEQLVERAASVAGAPEANWKSELRALTTERRSRLRAAFAYAKRRGHDPRLSGAADALELALVADKKGAFTGARWWHRSEVGLGVLLVGNTVNLLVNAARVGWWAVVPIALLLAVSVAWLSMWRRGIATGQVPMRFVVGKPPSAGRIPQTGERVLSAGRAAARAGDVDPAALAGVMQRAAASTPGSRTRPFAVAGLAYAERVLAASLEPNRTALWNAARTARQDLLAEDAGPLI